MIGVFSFLAGFWTFLSERVRINNISDRFMNGIIDSDKCDRGVTCIGVFKILILFPVDFDHAIYSFAYLAKCSCN